MNKKILICFYLVLMLFLMGGCQKKQEIEIGFIGTMTGSGSDLSVSGRRGVEVAISEVNSEGGVNGSLISLVTKNDNNDPSGLKAIVEEFESENVQFVIGPYTSGIITSSIEYINNQPILFIGPTISADVLSGKDDNFVRLIASTKEQAEVLTNIAFSKRHKKIGILYDERNKGFTDALVSNYKEMIKELYNPSVLELAYNPDDLKSKQVNIEKLIFEDVDAVFVVASAEECAEVSKLLKISLPNLQIYGPLWANTSELIKKGGVYVEDMIVVGGIDITQDSISINSFTNTYFLEYGEMPTFSSVYSYEATKILLDALKESKTLDYLEIKNHIVSKGVFDGVFEEIAIDQNGDCSRNYMAFIISSGQLKRIEE